MNSLQTRSLLYDRNPASGPLICNRERTFTANPERSLEYEICSERYLCLVCRDCCGSAVLIDGHLVGNPRQQLIKQKTHKGHPSGWPLSACTKGQYADRGLRLTLLTSGTTLPPTRLCRLRPCTEAGAFLFGPSFGMAFALLGVAEYCRECLLPGRTDVPSTQKTSLMQGLG